MSLDLADIVLEALARAQPEDLRTEYKATLASVDEERVQRTICAFANDLANRYGGMLLIGVREENGIPITPPQGLDPAEVDRIQKRIAELCASIKPEYAPIVQPVNVFGRIVVAVRCPGGDARPYKFKDAAWVRLGSSTKKAIGELGRQLNELAAHTPFDDRLRPDLTTAATLSLPLVLEHLRDSGSRLELSRLSADDLYQKLDLARPSDGHLSPRNVALLFFTSEPDHWIRGAVIDITHLPEGRAGSTLDTQRFQGPLAAQLRAALQHLRNLLPVRHIKQPDRAETLDLHPWPFAAIEEALVNAVYHRGYDVPEPTNVQIGPDAIRITSYPGPVPGLAREDLDRDDAPHVPARNRRIASLLREVKLAEAASSGLPLIRRAMRTNGNPPPEFRFDEDRTFFEVTLPIHPGFRTAPKVISAAPSHRSIVVVVNTSASSIREAVELALPDLGLGGCEVTELHHEIVDLAKEAAALESIASSVWRVCNSPGVEEVHLILRCPLAVAGAVVSVLRERVVILYQKDGARYFGAARLDRAFFHRVERGHG